METREATSSDWEKLLIFYQRIYRDKHPLQNKEFWEWQYGDKKQGRAFICLNDNGDVVGHVGANFGGGLAWIINVYLDPECRGKGVLRLLYELARNYYPLAATAANEAGLGLYRNMRWIRYHDLTRYVKINPNLRKTDFENVCQPVTLNVNDLIVKKTHYQKQPGQHVIQLSGESTGITQESVGGLRVVDLKDVETLETHAWELGYLWMDYITSWNDLKNKELEKRGWVLDFKSVVPWRLNPIEKDYFCDITFLSEAPLDKEFIVHRSYSDHGRVGSI
jgi:GNAT superfamily N-acetyltransferase